MTEYKRSPRCECSNYKDINELSIEERLSNKPYWMQGSIYENKTARECSCHKQWRLTNIYNKTALDVGLPSFEELKKLSYIGNSDSYKKLKALPSIITEHQLKDVLVFITGPFGCQKTTSLAKLMHQLISSSNTVFYISFTDLIERLNARKDDVSDLYNADWLIIEDCFDSETINFKTSYNMFYNLIIRRTKPTIISTVLSKDELLQNTSKPFYNVNMLNQLFAKVEKYNTSISFTDNVSKLLVTGANGSNTLDIWSL